MSCGCRPHLPFHSRPSWSQQLRHKPEPTGDLESIPRKKVLSGPRECVCVSMCMSSKSLSVHNRFSLWCMYQLLYVSCVPAECLTHLICLCTEEQPSGRYTTSLPHYQNLVPINPGITWATLQSYAGELV